MHGAAQPMVFNSLIFLVFFSVVLLVYGRLSHRGQNLFLLAASYLFYGWWDWRFLSLLILSSLADYWLGLRLEAESREGPRKLLVLLSILMNMGVLGFFKYYDFFATGLTVLFSRVGWHADLPTLHVLLPLGISFYTFLSMSYTIDVYRGHVRASRNPVDLLLYVAFFPHLVAGPIVRAGWLLPQCEQPRVVRRDEVLNGIWLCLLGYVKKMVIADRLAQIVDWGFSGAHPPFPNMNVWLIVYAFAFQIYGDFSGYSDIARGLSKLLGFELVQNFSAPYLVTNPSEFWRHWHISLSVWLRDYVYIPLGGNRFGSLRTYRNLFVTMILGGLWHGAGLAFLLWGLFHGMLLAAHRWLTGPGRRGATPKPAPATGITPGRVAATIGFFHVTCLGWLIFRIGAVSPGRQWPLLVAYLRALVQPPFGEHLSPLFLPVLLLGTLTFLVQWRWKRMNEFALWSERWQMLGVSAALCLLAAVSVFSGASFIYFQF